MEYEVIITRTALRDLEQIRAYIARDDPSAAQTFSLKLLDEAESLRTFPDRGGLIAERPGTRFVMAYPYFVIYRIVQKSRTVRVLRSWHGARERKRMWLYPKNHQMLDIFPAVSAKMTLIIPSSFDIRISSFINFSTRCWL